MKKEFAHVLVLKNDNKYIQQSFSIHDSSLEAHLVGSRLVYEYEKTIFI